MKQTIFYCVLIYLPHLSILAEIAWGPIVGKFDLSPVNVAKNVYNYSQFECN